MLAKLLTQRHSTLKALSPSYEWWRWNSSTSHIPTNQRKVHDSRSVRCRGRWSYPSFPRFEWCMCYMALSHCCEPVTEGPFCICICIFVFDRFCICILYIFVCVYLMMMVVFNTRNPDRWFSLELFNFVM